MMVDQMQREWEAWQVLFDLFCLHMKINREEANKRDAEFRPFFRAIQRWGNEYFRLRYQQVKDGTWDVNCEETSL